jgi:hypothetical protein
MTFSAIGTAERNGNPLGCDSSSCFHSECRRAYKDVLCAITCIVLPPESSKLVSCGAFTLDNSWCRTEGAYSYSLVNAVKDAC